MPMKNPPHPGDLIRTEIVEALGLNVSKAAEILKVRRATLSDLLHGKAALTPEMALRHRKGVRPAHGPPSAHATRLRRGENAGARAGHLDQALCPGLKTGQGIRATTTSIDASSAIRFRPGCRSSPVSSTRPPTMSNIPRSCWIESSALHASSATRIASWRGRTAASKRRPAWVTSPKNWCGRSCARFATAPPSPLAAYLGKAPRRGFY